MSLLVNLAESVFNEKKDTLQGRTVSRPTLFIGDEALNSFYVVDVDVGDENETMKDVAIASGNNEVRYADVSTPVELKRIAGHWQVIGFSKTMPGTFNRVPVTVPDFQFGLPTYSTGTVVLVSFEVRALTYQELADLGTYGGGATPYGALGKFQGGVLIEVFT